ncbi:MAG TPA: hypothetical protein VKY74_23570 [Chloroflexia bacterium]|nr:hypothetical protein [Chloroflexia bacterium]
MKLPGRQPKIQPVRTVPPRLPGPLQYLDLLPMLTLARTLTRDLPRGAYPLLALVIWRTIQSERRNHSKALLDAEREAIRRSQPVYVVKPKKKRFLLF